MTSLLLLAAAACAAPMISLPQGVWTGEQEQTDANETYSLKMDVVIKGDRLYTGTRSRGLAGDSAATVRLSADGSAELLDFRGQPYASGRCADMRCEFTLSERFERQWTVSYDFRGEQFAYSSRSESRADPADVKRTDIVLHRVRKPVTLVGSRAAADSFGAPVIAVAAVREHPLTTALMSGGCDQSGQGVWLAVHPKGLDATTEENSDVARLLGLISGPDCQKAYRCVLAGLATEKDPLVFEFSTKTPGHWAGRLQVASFPAACR